MKKIRIKKKDREAIAIRRKKIKIAKDLVRKSIKNKKKISTITNIDKKTMDKRIEAKKRKIRSIKKTDLVKNKDLGISILKGMKEIGFIMGDCMTRFIKISLISMSFLIII